MDRIEIFHQLVATVRDSQKLYEEAERRKAGLAEYIAAKIAKIRDAEQKAAELKVAEYEKNAIEEADRSLEELDAVFAREQAALLAVFNQHRGDLAERIFNIAINRSTP